MPSLIGAIGAVLLDLSGPRSPSSAGGPRWSRRVMMAACVLLGVEARLAKTDAMLLFTVVAAMGAMARVYLDRLDG